MVESKDEILHCKGFIVVEDHVALNDEAISINHDLRHGYMYLQVLQSR